jgi:hypothetical protein
MWLLPAVGKIDNYSPPSQWNRGTLLASAGSAPPSPAHKSLLVHGKVNDMYIKKGKYVFFVSF